MKKALIVLLGAVLFFSGMAQSEGGWSDDFTFSGGVDLKSRRVLDSLNVPNRSIVFQPWGKATYKPWNVYSKIWATVGVEDRPDTEVDYTLGVYGNSNDLTYDVSTSYFQLVASGGGIWSGELKVGHNYGWRGSLHYYNPTNGEDGWKVKGGYGADQWSLDLAHSEDLYEAQPITAVIGEYRYPITDDVNVSVTGLIPVIKNGDDDRSGQVFLGVGVSF